MSDWRDDLPSIPADRIRSEAIREGAQRRQRRQRRQRTLLWGGMGVAAVAVIAVSGVLIGPANDDDAASGTTAPAGTGTPAATEAAAAETTAAEAPAATEAAAAETTAAEAPAATEAAAAETTAAEATTPETVPIDYTTIRGPSATLPVNPEIEVVPAVIWEQRSSGPACGPTTLELVIPQPLGLANPVARWQTAEVTGEIAMVLDSAVAHATIGPFGQELLDAGERHELLIIVMGTDPSGVEQVLRAPTAVLIDCS